MRTVYVIEIAAKWHGEVAPGLPRARSCFYVGETRKPPSRRFQDHLEGRSQRDRRRNLSGAVFKVMRKRQSGALLERGSDARLRFGLMAGLDPVPDVERAEALEALTIDRLRAEGHCVYPEGPGEIPFESYRP